MLVKDKIDTIIQSGIKYNLINFNIPKGPFITIETLVPDKSGLKVIHTIMPTSSKNSFKLGRGHEPEVRINDISVSRLHAEIKFENNQFLIKDSGSKFGTLKLIKTSFNLKPEVFHYFEVGRTLIKLVIDLHEMIMKLMPIKEPNKLSNKQNTEMKWVYTLYNYFHRAQM